MSRHADASSIVPRARPLFFGRDDELHEISRRLDGADRLLTILGPPGIGKTRLAQQALATLVSCNALFCDVTSASDLSEVCDALRRTLGATPPVGLEIDALVTHLGEALAELGAVVVVFDNMEQVAHVAAPALRAWYAAAPAARFLVTSRERLQVEEETVLELGPLDPEREGVPLFEARARAAGVRIRPADHAEIAALVRDLDGLPLAVELAAARSRVLTPAEIRARLTNRLDLLAAAGRPSRHATLRAAIEGSWELLSAHEQRALAQCSVFVGGFGVEAAESVLCLGEDAPSVLHALGALRDKSLLRNIREDGGVSRFDTYVSIREYAAERLRELDPGDETRARHARHYLAAAHAWTGGLTVALSEDAAARQRLAVERDNLVAAFRWAAARAPRTVDSASMVVECALAIEPVMSTLGPVDDAVAVLDVAVEATQTPGVPVPLAAKARIVRANVLGIRGRVTQSIADLQEAIRMLRDIGDAPLAGEALSFLGIRQRQLGRFDLAWRCHEEAARALVDSPRRRFEALNFACMGRMQGDFGRFDESRALNERAAAMARTVPDRFVEGLALGNLAQVHQETGAWSDAAWCYERAVAALREVADPRYEAIYVGHAGDLSFERGDLDDARARYKRSIAALERLRIPRAEGFFRASLAVLEARRGALDAARDELHAAQSLLETAGDPAYLIALELHRLDVDLSAGRPANEVRGQLDRVVPADAPLDVRFAARVLRRALDADVSPRAPARSSPPASPAAWGGAWIVSGDARNVTSPDGRSLDLSRRGAVRRVLLALVDAHLGSPGRSLSQDTLLAHGWPGERVLPEAAANRVRVAIATLRALGWGRAILTHDDGYALDPSVRVERR